MLVLALTLYLPHCFMLFEVGPNLDSLGDATIDLLFCVADPLCADLGHHDRKAISSFRYSEGRRGDPSSSLCFREGGRITSGVLFIKAMLICWSSLIQFL